MLADLGRAGSRALEFESAGRTETGLVRQLNEDAVIIRDDIGLWAVADGMGGHSSGDVASAAIITALAALSPARHAHEQLRQLTSALHAVNDNLVSLAQHSGDKHAVIGATVAALLVSGGHYAAIWAGDCRVYLLRNGRLVRLTKDHSAIQSLVDAGTLTEDEARLDRRSNLVTRAVGAAPELVLDHVSGRVRPGDVFLICSDGVSGVLANAQIREDMSDGSIRAATDRLFKSVVAAGAPDNLSAIIVRAAPAKWVESSRYVGFERRARAGLRLLNRRSTKLEAQPPPSTQSIVRQLRAHCLGLDRNDNKDRFLVRLEGAIGLAEAHGDIDCADILLCLREQLDVACSSQLGDLVEAALSQAHSSVACLNAGQTA